MKDIKKLVHLLLLVLPVLVTVNCCQSSRSFDHSTCIFSFTETDTSCDTFSFNQCSWQKCVRWSSMNNVTTCSQYRTFNDLRWGYCTQVCCDPDVGYPLTYSSLDKCQEYLNQQFKITGIIIGSVIGGVSFIILVVVIISCCRDKIQNCCEKRCDYFKSCIHCIFCCFKQKDTQISPVVVQQVTTQLPSVKWQNVDQEKQAINSATCSVCLEEGCSLELPCHHQYHRQCIMTCLQKNEECILCRSQNLTEIKVYCQHCFRMYLKANYHIQKAMLQKNQICDTCLQNPNPF